MSDEPIVLLDTVANEPLAQMWVDVLSDAGIPAITKAGGPGIGAWGSSAMLEHEIYVQQSQLAAARQIVEAYDLKG